MDGLNDPMFVLGKDLVGGPDFVGPTWAQAGVLLAGMLALVIIFRRK